MTEHVRNLITALVYNKGKDSEFWVKMILNADKTAKDKMFRENALKELDKLARNKEIQVPANCSFFLEAEAEPDINLNRYLLSEKEKGVFEEIKKMQQVSEELERRGIRYANLLLLYGKPGTGKTTFGRYIAKMLGLPFLYVKLSFLLDSYLGNSQKNIANMFRFAKSMECVLLIDEIDGICASRGDKRDVSEIGRVAISIMQEINKLNGNVILLGATNRVDILDDAILNRFTIKHEVKEFTEQEGETFIKKYMDDVGVEYSIQDVQKMNKWISQRELEYNLINFIAKKLYEEPGDAKEENRKEEGTDETAKKA